VPEIQGGQSGDESGQDPGAWYEHNDGYLALALSVCSTLCGLVQR
jgi:hypothetical protein